jgi:ribonuclease BN (tRNA processing enzyme)
MMKKTITKEVRFMKLTYLGTAAAEGWPALFCRCEYCKKALERGGKNLRTRSQAMVNDDLLIDFPADSFSHMQQNGLNFSAVKTLLITHSHMDHFSPTDLHLRSTSLQPPCAPPRKIPEFHCETTEEIPILPQPQPTDPLYEYNLDPLRLSLA